MRKLDFVLVGCGRAGALHLPYILKYGRLKTVIDTNEEKGREWAKKYNCTFYIDVEDFIGEEIGVDVVVICSPNYHHFYPARFALCNKMNVLIEKPMVLSLTHADRLIKYANKSNVQIFTVMQNRFNPAVVAVKKVLDKGDFGKLYSIQINCFWNRNSDYYSDDWHGTKSMDGGILFTQFSHFIDLLIWFFGMPDLVKGVANKIAHGKEMEIDDQGAAIMQWKNGMIGTLQYSVNAFEQNREGSITIMGEHGMVKIGGSYLNRIDYQYMKGASLEVKEKNIEANNYGSYTGSMGNHEEVYKSMANNLLKGKPYYTNVKEAKQTIGLIKKIMKRKN
jgi:UDP-N-acetyl-2-amino-2-deoxyglucuronate dehydrogenase